MRSLDGNHSNVNEDLHFEHQSPMCVSGSQYFNAIPIVFVLRSSGDFHVFLLIC